jgi:hypothetical protein
LKVCGSCCGPLQESYFEKKEKKAPKISAQTAGIILKLITQEAYLKKHYC